MRCSLTQFKRSKLNMSSLWAIMGVVESLPPWFLLLNTRFQPLVPRILRSIIGYPPFARYTKTQIGLSFSFSLNPYPVNSNNHSRSEIVIHRTKHKKVSQDQNMPHLHDRTFVFTRSIFSYIFHCSWKLHFEPLWKKMWKLMWWNLPNHLLYERYDHSSPSSHPVIPHIVHSIVFLFSTTLP